MNKEVKSLQDTVNKGIGGASQEATKMGLTYTQANTIFNKTVGVVKSMVGQYANLNAATIEFQKVSELSGKGLDDYIKTLSGMGREVARTTSEMIEGATEFRKSGFSDTDSAKLAKTSALFQNVADEELSAGDAANFLVSQMTAFNLTADEASHVVDAVNKVSNNFAVSSGDLSKALPLVASSLSVGNTEFEEMIGLMTGAIEVTRNSSRAARGLVSIQSRLNQVVDESSTTGQKLTQWYGKHSIDLYDENKQLRSLYDVLGDVAKQWPELTENEKRYFLNTQAGANQTVNLASILENFDHVIKATETALDSEGSAMEENQAYMQGFEA